MFHSLTYVTVCNWLLLIVTICFLGDSTVLVGSRKFKMNEGHGLKGFWYRREHREKEVSPPHPRFSPGAASCFLVEILCTYQIIF